MERVRNKSVAEPGSRAAANAVQPKLKIGSPGDRYEIEADRMADKVVSLADPVTNPENAPAGDIQHNAPGGAVINHYIQRQPEKEEKECQCGQETDEKQPAPGIWLEGALRRSKQDGDPLPNDTKSFMESRFGQDFEQVKIHHDARAAEMSEALGANAFTHGRDIYFNQGRFQPGTAEGRHLIAHELTHTIQQHDGAAPGIIQGDFAVAPTTPNRAVTALTDTQIASAITYNEARYSDPAEIGLVRDILGISEAPAVIDREFIEAVVRYQAAYGQVQDGRIGGHTADRLAREIIAEADYLGAGNEGSLAIEFGVKTSLQALVDADNRTYNDYKAAIQAGSLIQGWVVLQDQTLLRSIRSKLSWNNFARCIELLGRQAPTGAEMIANSNVQAALGTAFTASNAAVTIWPTIDPADPGNACNPPAAGAPATTAHEEGGFIYMNLFTGDLSTRAVAAGGQAALTLTAPAIVTDSVVVGGYHTHPNVGACWGAPFFSTADETWVAHNGVPLLMRGAFPTVADTSDHAHGSRRSHLAGSQGLPGAGGGLAPQATRNGENDRL